MWAFLVDIGYESDMKITFFNNLPTKVNEVLADDKGCLSSV